jgi:hypothetical protein
MGSEPGAAAAVMAAVPGLEPWPAPTISAAFVSSHAAADPQAYGALFDRLPSAAAPPVGTKRLSISLHSAVVSPWTDGYNDLQYIAGRHLLHRSGEWVHLPNQLAERIERDADLLPPADGSRVPRAIVGGIVGGLLLVGGVSLYAVTTIRRRREPARRDDAGGVGAGADHADLEPEPSQRPRAREAGSVGRRIGLNGVVLGYPACAPR